MGLVCLAQASHPELEKLDVVLLSSSQDAQQFLGILLGSAVHFSEFEEDLHFIHPLLLQADKALIHNIYRKVLVGQGSFDLVQDCRANYSIRKRGKRVRKRTHKLQVTHLHLYL